MVWILSWSQMKWEDQDQTTARKVKSITRRTSRRWAVPKPLCHPHYYIMHCATPHQYKAAAPTGPRTDFPSRKVHRRRWGAGRCSPSVRVPPAAHGFETKWWVRFIKFWWDHLKAILWSNLAPNIQRVEAIFAGGRNHQGTPSPKYV